MHASENDTLTIGALTLNAYTEADLPALVELCNDPDVVAYTTVPHPYTQADADGFMEREAQRPHDMLWAIRHTDHGYVGSFGLTALDTDCPFVWYMLCPQYRGMGMVSDAMAAVLGWLKGRGYARVGLFVMPGNVASKRVAGKAGFEHIWLELDADERLGDLVDVEYWERPC